jgi:hypothetical protein
LKDSPEEKLQEETKPKLEDYSTFFNKSFTQQMSIQRGFVTVLVSYY